MVFMKKYGSFEEPTQSQTNHSLENFNLLETQTNLRKTIRVIPILYLVNPNREVPRKQTP